MSALDVVVREYALASPHPRSAAPSRVAASGGARQAARWRCQASAGMVA